MTWRTERGGPYQRAERVTLTSEAADDANLLIIKEAWLVNLVVKCPCKGHDPMSTRLVKPRRHLQWRGVRPGTGLPRLDHMILRRIFFAVKAQLMNVDDCSSYGPETITLQKSITAKATSMPCTTLIEVIHPAGYPVSGGCSCIWGNPEHFTMCPQNHTTAT